MSVAFRVPYRAEGPLPRGFTLGVFVFVSKGVLAGVGYSKTGAAGLTYEVSQWRSSSVNGSVEFRVA